MGTRINVVIIGDGKVACVLFSNSHHPDIDAELILKEIVREAAGLSDVAEKLLGIRYPSAVGGHTEGSRVFVLDTAPGDCEKVLRVERHGFGFHLTVVSDTPLSQLPNHSVNSSGVLRG